MIWLRIIDKLLNLWGSTVFHAKTGRHAVLSYMLIPPIKVPGYFSRVHNNRLKSFYIAKSLNQMGFDVEIRNYLRMDFEPGRDCALFIGHNISFATIVKRLRTGVPRILIITGSYPQFGNEQQAIRARNLEARRGIRLKVYEDNIVPDLSENLELADRILVLGSEFVRNTYPEKYRHKMVLFNNILNVPLRKREISYRNFLFISSIGQVHRGLDLVLEVFAGRQEKLYVCSSFRQEPEFEAAYRKELHETENVIPEGFMNMGSKRAAEVFSDCGFCILPSCSEGQSGSVLSAMGKSLLPIITRNCGIPNVERYGWVIEGAGVEDVRDAVEAALSADENELARRRETMWRAMKDFTGAEFAARFQQLAANVFPIAAARVEQAKSETAAEAEVAGRHG